MNAVDYYSPSCQFKRALNRDWRLYGIDLLCGTLYPLIGFYLFHRVGQSQVYSVITPFVATAGFVVYLTRRICLPEVKRESTFYYFNLPMDRVTALDAHVTVLGLVCLWLVGWVFFGGLLKLGGAGITACYRFHPEIVVLPFLVAALAVRHIYVIHGRRSWVWSLLWYGSLAAWVVWKYFAIAGMPANSGNNYWPDRPMSLSAEWALAGIMAVAAACLVHNTRIQWRKRQIGGIR